MRTSGFDRPELDEVLCRFILKGVVEEFCSPVCLNPLTRELKRIRHVTQEINCGLSFFVRVQLQSPETGTIIYGGKPVTFHSYFGHIPLHAIAHNGPVVAGIPVMLAVLFNCWHVLLCNTRRMVAAASST